MNKHGRIEERTGVTYDSLTVVLYWILRIDCEMQQFDAKDVYESEYNDSVDAVAHELDLSRNMV